MSAFPAPSGLPRHPPAFPRGRVIATLVFLRIAFAAAPLARGQIATNFFQFVPDVAATVFGQNVPNHALSSVGPFAGGPYITPPIADPHRVKVDAFAMLNATQYVFSVDVPALIGGIPFHPTDLIGCTVGQTDLWKFIDGRVQLGLSEGANLNAVSVVPGNGFWFSVDSAAGALNKGALYFWSFADLAITQIETPAALGIPGNANLNAVYEENGQLYFSIDRPMTGLGGQKGRAADVWRRNGNNPVPLPMPLLPNVDLNALHAPMDGDGDGLTDLEELLLLDDPATTFPGGGSAPLAPQVATNPNLADTDGDGANDGQEAAAKTDPLNDLDFLRLTLIGDIGSNRLIQWTSVLGVKYRVEAAPALDQPYAILLNSFTAGDLVSGYLHPIPSDDFRVYRVLVLPP